MPRSRLFALLLLIVCVVLAALALLNLFHLNLPPFIFLGQLTIPCLSLAAGIGFIGIILQFKRVVAVAAIAAALFGASLLPWLTAREIGNSAPGPQLRVMYAYAPIGDQPSRLLRNFIARNNPDLIALSEPSFKPVKHHPEVLGRAYPYSRQIGRISLFSKTPLDDVRVDFFDDRFVSLHLTSRIGPLNLRVVRLPRLWPYGEWEQYDIELGRLEQITRDNTATPTLVIGDFNAALSSAPLLNFVKSTGYRPATSPVGTWPAHMPPYVRLAVDNAFISPELKTTKFSVGPEYASDHRPIVIEIQSATAESPTAQ